LNPNIKSEIEELGSWRQKFKGWSQKSTGSRWRRELDFRITK